VWAKLAHLSGGTNMSSVGLIEVIYGCMFCGKSAELLRLIDRARRARQFVLVFKHAKDGRYNGSKFVSTHNGGRMPCVPVQTASQIWDIVITSQRKVNVVAIDEAQFFDDSIIRIIEDLVNRGVRVIVAGLNLDFRGEPFGPMAQIITRAEEEHHLTAICTQCGEPAYFTQRWVNGEPPHYDDPIIMVGASESYDARCRRHHIVIKEPRNQPLLIEV